MSLAVLLASCGDDTEDPNPDPGPSDPNNPGGGDNTQYVPAPRGPTRPQTVPGPAVDCASGGSALSGRFIAPNGNTPIAGAFVYINSGDCWAGTDQDGRFTAKGLPAAETSVSAEKGVFRSDGTATPGGSALSLQVDPSEARLAYVAGSFDSIQVVLERLGFAPDQIDEDSLSSGVLTDYDAVFFNCGMSETQAEDPEVQDALKAYVEGGGVLYASDWAEVYVKAVFPSQVTFLGSDPRVGTTGEVQATVLDEGLKRALGKEQATINFDAPNWAVIDSVPAGTQVLVRGPVTTSGGTALADRPYMVQFQAGEGRVTYTSFHNEALTTADMDTLLEQLLFQL
jgi:hypothetical protein